MGHPRSVHSFGKYVLMSVSFSDIPCALPLGDGDEIKRGLSHCCSSCKMRPLSAFLRIRTLASRQMEVRRRTITILEQGSFFFCCLH